MSLHEDLNSLARRDLADLPKPEAAAGWEATPVVKPQAPKGWEAGVETSGEGGQVCTGPVDGPVTDWASFLALWNLDPAQFAVLEPVTCKAWDMGAKNNAGQIETKRMYSYKARIVRRSAGMIPADELAEIRRQIELAPPIQPRYVPTFDAGNSTFVVCLADWQIGKGERDGSAGTVSRIQKALDTAEHRLRELLQLGRPIEQIAFVGLGDLVEGCTGFYSMQEFQTDLTRREQVNVVRSLLLRALRQFAQIGLPVMIASAAGNHGENRKDGKAFTTFGDNDDLAVFEQVRDVVEAAPDAFGNPSFVIPGDELNVCLELSGIRVAAVHGHQFGAGASASAKAMTWWQKQALGDQGVGAAKILLSGHLHHFTVTPHGGRTHIQAPSLDSGSAWFRQVAGVDSPSGILTLLVGSGCGELGWSDVAMLPVA